MKIKRTKAYLIQLSRGESVPMDQDELDKVVEAMGTGKVAILRQGIVNPSYITSIVPDSERIEAFMDDTKYDGERRNGGLLPLKNIFEGTQVGKMIVERDQKLLDNGEHHG